MDYPQPAPGPGVVPPGDWPPAPAAPLPTVEQLAGSLREASEEHASAKRKVDEARRAETDALNAVNRMQELFDKACDGLRGSAHIDTDWGADKRVTGRSAE